MDNEIIEQIVNKAANAVMQKIDSEKHAVTTSEIAQSEEPQVYGVAIKRRWLWPKRYKVIGHFEDRALQSQDGQLYPCAGRLVLTFPNQAREAIPNLDNLHYAVYPL